MKKLLWVLIPILCMPFLCGVAIGSKPKDFHVLKITDTGNVIIDATAKMTKPKKRFDIFKTGENLTAFDNPNKIIGQEEIIVARIIITQTTPTYSVGTIVSWMDGSRSKADSRNISKGMLCRKTMRKTLKAEKKIYKYEKKSQKRQYKLTKLKAKSETYKALDKSVQDINNVTIKAGQIKIEKNKIN